MDYLVISRLMANLKEHEDGLEAARKEHADIIEKMRKHTKGLEIARMDLAHVLATPAGGGTTKSPTVREGTKSEAILSLLSLEGDMGSATIAQRTGDKKNLVVAALIGLSKRGFAVCLGSHGPWSITAKGRAALGQVPPPNIEGE